MRLFIIALLFAISYAQTADEWGSGVRGYYIDTEDKERSEPDQPGSVEACKALCITENGCKSINWAHVFGVCWLIPLSRAEAEQLGKWKADPNVIHYDKIQQATTITATSTTTAECVNFDVVTYPG